MSSDGDVRMAGREKFRQSIFPPFAEHCCVVSNYPSVGKVICVRLYKGVRSHKLRSLLCRRAHHVAPAEADKSLDIFTSRVGRSGEKAANFSIGGRHPIIDQAWDCSKERRRPGAAEDDDDDDTNNTWSFLHLLAEVAATCLSGGTVLMAENEEEAVWPPAITMDEPSAPDNQDDEECLPEPSDGCYGQVVTCVIL